MADSEVTPAGLRPERIEQSEKEHVSHYRKELDLTDDSVQNLTDLAQLNPHGGARVLHGRLANNPAGSGLIVVPDTASVQQELEQFNLDQDAIRLFAIVAAAQGNILQAEHDYEHTPVVMTGSGEMEYPSPQEVATRKLKYKAAVADNAKGGADALHRLNNSLGDKKFREIIQWLNITSVTRRKSELKHVDENQSKAKAACLEGFKTCSFPEGVAANCAGYLGLTVKELKEKCPVIKNSNGK